MEPLNYYIWSIYAALAGIVAGLWSVHLLEILIDELLKEDRRRKDAFNRRK